jgi:hypothetical protein
LLVVGFSCATNCAGRRELAATTESAADFEAAAAASGGSGVALDAGVQCILLETCRDGEDSSSAETEEEDQGRAAAVAAAAAAAGDQYEIQQQQQQQQQQQRQNDNTVAPGIGATPGCSTVAISSASRERPRYYSSIRVLHQRCWAGHTGVEFNDSRDAYVFMFPPQPSAISD